MSGRRQNWNIGDGKIFVHPVESRYGIATGERARGSL